MIVLTCRHCAGAFENERSTVQFCSPKCGSLFKRGTIPEERLAPFIEQGVPIVRIAAELKVSKDLVRAVMQRKGVYRAWRHRRYKKCAVAA